MYVGSLNSHNMINVINRNLAKYSNKNNNKSIKINNTTSFSLNYSSKGVSSIINSIKVCFEGESSLKDKYTYDSDGAHLIDKLNSSENSDDSKAQDINKVDDSKADIYSFTKDYGEILNKIKSDDELSKDDKSKLTMILDKSFNGYADKLSKALSDKISGFLNYAANNKDEVYQKYGIKINADKIVDGNELSENIKNMISASKLYYANNTDVSDQDLNAYISSKFNETKSIEDMSYKDLILSKNELSHSELDDVRDIFDKNDVIKENTLKSKGASQILQDSFDKAASQNEDLDSAVDNNKKLDNQFKDAISKLEDKVKGLKKSIQELSDEATDLDKEYQYKLRDIKEEKLRKMALIAELSKDSVDKDKKIKLAQEDHDRKLKEISKRSAKMQGQISKLLKEIKKENDEYKKFKKDPNSYIEGISQDKDDSIESDKED